MLQTSWSNICDTRPATFTCVINLLEARNIPTTKKYRLANVYETNLIQRTAGQTTPFCQPPLLDYQLYCFDAQLEFQ